MSLVLGPALLGMGAAANAPAIDRSYTASNPARAALVEGISSIRPVGDSFKIGTGLNGIAGTQAIAFDGTNFLAVWRSNGTAYATRVTQDGVVLDPDGIQVGSSASANPSVAFDGANYLVVWASGGQIVGRGLTRQGTVIGTPVVIADNAKDRPVGIAFDGTNYFIAWRTPGDAIQAARVSKNGANLDGLGGFNLGGGFYPWVAYGGGQYLVVWHAHGPNGLDIFGARVGTDGTILGNLPISTATEDQDHASAASNGTDFFVAWHDYRGGNDHNDGSTRGARVSASGAVLDDPAISIGDYARGQPPAVVVFDGTDYLVTWQVDMYPAKYRNVDAFGRRVSPSGAVVDTQPIPLGTSYGHQWGPTVGIGNDRYLVAWNESLSGGRCYGGCSYGRVFQKAMSGATGLTVTQAAPPAAVASIPSGRAWARVSSPLGDPIHHLWAYDVTHVYAVTESDDGLLIGYNGQAWVPLTGLPNARKFGLWGTSPTDLWAVGWCWDIVRYNGTTWEHTNCGPAPSWPAPRPIAMGVWGPDNLRILTVGVQGNSIRYEGAGFETAPLLDRGGWRDVATGVTNDLWDIWGTGAQSAYAVGELGTILKYNGSTWTRETGVPSGQSLNAIWGSGPNDIFVVGDFGTILHFDGVAWGLQASGTKEHLTGVSGLSGSDVYAVGFNGTILHYDGTIWMPEASGTAAALLDVVAVGETVWVVGDSGTILGTGTTPSITIDDRVVSEGAVANAAFRVLLSGSSPLAVTVQYATANNAALAGSDYTETSGTLTFTPGRTTHSVFVPILADGIAEGEETFAVTLSNAVNATIGDATATGTIQDPATPADIPMYRAYNPNAFYHFFTTSLGEFNNAVAAGYRDESNPPCCAIPFKVPNLQGSGKAAIFRMYNPNNGRHYYTANSGERDVLMDIGWVYEKDEGFVYTSVQAGTAEVFKLYNNISGVHLCTVKADEKNAILSQFPGVWFQHTSLGFAVP